MNHPLKVHPGLVGSSCGHVAVLPSGMVWLAGMPWVSGCEVKVTVWLPVLACSGFSFEPVVCVPAGAVDCLVVSGLGVASGVGEAVAVMACVAAAGDCGVAVGDGIAVGAVRPSPATGG